MLCKETRGAKGGLQKDVDPLLTHKRKTPHMTSYQQCPKRNCAPCSHRCWLKGSRWLRHCRPAFMKQVLPRFLLGFSVQQAGEATTKMGRAFERHGHTDKKSGRGSGPELPLRPGEADGCRRGSPASGSLGKAESFSHGRQFWELFPDSPRDTKAHRSQLQ